MLASSWIDRGFKPLSGQSKDYAICICCFSAKHAQLRRESKDWLARNQDNVSGMTASDNPFVIFAIVLSDFFE
jgi:hypothetical protein